MSSALFTSCDATGSESPKDAGYLSLDGTDYWASPESLRSELALYNDYAFFQSGQSPLEFSTEWLEAQKQDFIQREKSKLDPSELSEQFSLIFDMLERRALLTALIGPPGAAKSVIASLWTHVVRACYPNMPVFLTTQERPALQRLNEKISIENAIAVTIDDALNPDTVWPDGAAVIIDEAGLFGTETMTQLLRRARACNTVKIILIGDDKQLVPNAPGQPFRWICEQSGTDIVKLSQPFRQKTPELRQAVNALYEGNIDQALPLIPFHFVPSPDIVPQVRRMLLAESQPDTTLVVVHGSTFLQERLRTLCPGFRIFSLAAAQGLAIDRVILVVAQEINKAEFLVGCSRQRFTLDVFVDNHIYNDGSDFAANIKDYPKNMMALDIISPEKLLQIVDQAQVAHCADHAV